MNAILIHGWADKNEFYDLEYPTASNSHWFPWLSKQLMVKDIHTVALEMPKGYYPEYSIWAKELERFDINEDTILIGHSCGAGFILRYLSDNPEKKVNKVVLVAPWLGVRFNEEPFDQSFFDFDLRPDVASQTKGLHVLSSTDDMQAVIESVQTIRGKVDNLIYREFNDKGHFNLGDMGSEEFPELLQEIVS